MPARPRTSAIAIALFFAPLAACALQTAGLGPPDEGALDGGTPTPTTHDASSFMSDDAAASADVARLPDASDDASSADASGADVADSSPRDATSDANDPCDKDGDGHREMGNVCFGDDCCDVDANVHPGQTGYFATQSACSSFDYDCDGTASVESGTVSCKLGFFSCSGDGFAAPTACGVIARYETCSWAGFSCNTNDEMRPQKCR